LCDQPDNPHELGATNRNGYVVATERTASFLPSNVEIYRIQHLAA
jgi:hypothetical protein